MQRQMTYTGALLAIGVLIPGIFHMTGIPGTIFLPMHIPVLMGGLLLSPGYALFLGLVLPLLNSTLLGMPPILPIGVLMSVELGLYGLVASLVKRRMNVFLTLITSMVVGRIGLGLFAYLLVSLDTIKLNPMMYLQGAIVTGLPGMIIQLILIPLIVSRVKAADHAPHAS